MLAALVVVWIGWQIWWHVTAEPAPVIDYAAELEALIAALAESDEVERIATNAVLL